MSIKLLKNAVKHTILVTKHKWLVFKFCCKLGMPIRGLMHDLSKFSFEEFSESIKYYNGKISPITGCKKDKGYSKAWLHHKGRNKHHDSYWVCRRGSRPRQVRRRNRPSCASCRPRCSRRRLRPGTRPL